MGRSKEKVLINQGSTLSCPLAIKEPRHGSVRVKPKIPFLKNSNQQLRDGSCPFPKTEELGSHPSNKERTQVYPLESINEGSFPETEVKFS